MPSGCFEWTSWLGRFRSSAPLAAGPTSCLSSKMMNSTVCWHQQGRTSPLLKGDCLTFFCGYIRYHKIATWASAVSIFPQSHRSTFPGFVQMGFGLRFRWFSFWLPSPLWGGPRQRAANAGAQIPVKVWRLPPRVCGACRPERSARRSRGLGMGFGSHEGGLQFKHHRLYLSFYRLPSN